MRAMNDRITDWARAHPWQYASFLGVVVGIGSAGLRLVLQRGVEDSVGYGALTGAVWFVLTGVVGALRLRGIDRRGRPGLDQRRPPA